MRTLINVVIILLIGAGIGLVMRMAPWQKAEQLPGEEIVMSHGGGSELTSQPTRPAGIDEETLSRVGEKAERVEGWMYEYALTERSGQSMGTAELAGQPHVVSFFFSTCPSVCKLQNEKMQQLQTEFAGQGIRFVAISVDPVVDTPEVLAEYAKRYRADEDQWLFFTGDMTYIRRVAAEVYGVAVSEKFHTEKFILVNAEGDVVGYYTWTDPTQFQRLKKDIGRLLSHSNGAT